MPTGPAPSAEASLRAALTLLKALQAGGMRHGVVCPGSRSAPLAVAAGLLEASGLRLHPAVDERSAAFFALGLGRALGAPAAVITTSGSAVAQLLPACVEADQGGIPLLLLSADRPSRLKRCGANQSVNQETFLRDSCRWFGEGDGDGLHRMESDSLESLARRALRHCLGGPAGPPPGAVHLNLPLEEPLHAEASVLAALARELAQAGSAAAAGPPAGTALLVEASRVASVRAVVRTDPSAAPDPPRRAEGLGAEDFGAVDLRDAASDGPRLDPDQPGVVVAGPWRGSPEAWPGHLDALRRWQARTGWPLLADPLSGLRGQPGLGTISAYDLLLSDSAPALAAPQVLRLGSLPASRALERWLTGLEALQLLISEADPRRLDPLGVVARQWPQGLQRWLDRQAVLAPGEPSAASLRLRRSWERAEQGLQRQLNARLDGSAGWSEPALVRQLSRLLPAGLPLMLANSSPVRDWANYADPGAAPRPVHGFRGASGIDGTLSEACGLAEALGELLLLSGDLALLHDTNGWLWRPGLRGRLTVVLIDNRGGGIFEQLPIRSRSEELLDFERLFAMPQPVDPLALAAVHGVPARAVPTPAALAEALAWALAQPFSLLVVRSDRRRDAALRGRLRTMTPPEGTPP